MPVFNPDDDNAPGSPPPTEPAPDELRCSTCHDAGGLCWDCGAIDQPSIGRKIVYLQHNDRPTLLRILDGTPRSQWPLLARAYVAALGVTEQGQAVPMLGVVSLRNMLVKEAA